MKNTIEESLKETAHLHLADRATINRALAELLEPLSEVGAPPEDTLDHQLSGYSPKSPKGVWVARADYDEDDIPTWRPLDFAGSFMAMGHLLGLLKEKGLTVALFTDSEGAHADITDKEDEELAKVDVSAHQEPLAVALVAWDALRSLRKNESS